MVMTTANRRKAWEEIEGEIRESEEVVAYFENYPAFEKSLVDKIQDFDIMDYFDWRTYDY